MLLALFGATFFTAIVIGMWSVAGKPNSFWDILFATMLHSAMIYFWLVVLKCMLKS